MRKVIYLHMVSLDGFIETKKSYSGPNWAVSDEALTRHFIDIESAVDTHLYGRRVFESLADGWPAMAKDPSSPKDVAEYARLWLNKPKIVFSKTLDHVEWNARLVKENPVNEIAKLKAQPGKDLFLFGGVLASSLIPHGLIDEYRCYVNPVVLGGDTPMFPNMKNLLRLKLLEAKTFDCGVVLLHYANSDQS